MSPLMKCIMMNIVFYIFQRTARSNRLKRTDYIYHPASNMTFKCGKLSNYLIHNLMFTAVSQAITNH